MVNHKNFNRRDNRVENLEWCSYSENMTHSGTKNYKPVLKIDKDGNTIEEYKSITEAAKSSNSSTSGIVNVCKGKQKTCKGFRWQYKNNDAKTC